MDTKTPEEDPVTQQLRQELKAAWDATEELQEMIRKERAEFYGQSNRLLEENKRLKKKKKKLKAVVKTLLGALAGGKKDVRPFYEEDEDAGEQIEDYDTPKISPKSPPSVPTKLYIGDEIREKDLVFLPFASEVWKHDESGAAVAVRKANVGVGANPWDGWVALGFDVPAGYRRKEYANKIVIHYIP